MANDTIPSKRCSFCEQEFPATHEYFTYDKTKPGGLYSRCRSCQKKRRVKEFLPDGYKRCTKCKNVKAIDEFGAYKTKAPSWCKRCCADAVMAKYIPSARVKLTPEELKRRKKEHDKRYTSQNQSKIKAYRKRYYAQHREIAIERTRQWVITNPLRAKLNNKIRKAKRRALERKAEGVFTKDDLLIQYRSQKGRCWWCGRELHDEYHADHLRPLNRGGSNHPNNIVLSCAACNQSRQDKLPHEWSDRLL